MATITDASTRHHDVIRDLLPKIAEDRSHFETLRNHLTIHHKNEETFLYDLLEQKEKTRHGGLEAVEEHHVIEMLLQELDNFPPGSRAMGYPARGVRRIHLPPSRGRGEGCLPRGVEGARKRRGTKWARPSMPQRKNSSPSSDRRCFGAGGGVGFG